MSNDRHKYRVAVKQGLEWQIYDILEILYKKNGTIWVQVISHTESAIFSACFQVDGENVILEQCTGLKDKNGKLIFEGDVLLFNGSRNPVYFDDGSFVILHSGSVFIPIKQKYTDVFEIIGNIHEDQFREVTKKVEGDKCD